MADTAVAEKKETLPTTIMADMAAFAGEGMDSIGTEDMQIPFLRVLQALSPEIQKNDPKFIKGASAGDLVNTVTGQTWDGDDGVIVIPCGYAVKYLEFALRDSGGGFQGEIPAILTLPTLHARVMRRCYPVVMSWFVQHNILS